MVGNCMCTLYMYVWVFLTIEGLTMSAKWRTAIKALFQYITINDIWYRLSYGCISISPLPVYMLTKLKLLLIWKHWVQDFQVSYFTLASDN